MNDHKTPIDEMIGLDSQILSAQLHELSERLFPPSAEKELRTFSSAEAAALIGITDSYIRQLAKNDDGIIPPKKANGRREFTLPQIHDLRRYLARSKPQYLPNRTTSQKLQTIAVTNFKGGSGKTTTAIHLAQYLALRGYRVLALDLDPQASMSAMLGCQPEFDVSEDQTIYGAIKYDEDRVPIKEVIRKTYFAGLDFIPADLELQEFEQDTPMHLASTDRDPRNLFFMRIAEALKQVEEDYDVVVIDCPPQLGYLTLAALSAATSVLITIHPQMLDVASMSQFLNMTSNLLRVVREAGGNLDYGWMSYLITRHEPNDGPQAQVAAFLRSLFSDRVLTATMLKSTAVSDSGLSNQTLYETRPETMHRRTYDRAVEAMNSVNEEIEKRIRQTWERSES
ncbi:plasmid partitioning protein RepA [uncultured Roseibium sp.]|uniref:plasmid partitioning protein RepA n=1 Tax=uncultured Roseibium sp. TaxID=1936171 RepID=UPI00261D6049|nr:plasmid partitioning protein RepA [uncultured Roseibium sp.]